MSSRGSYSTRRLRLPSQRKNSSNCQTKSRLEGRSDAASESSYIKFTAVLCHSGRCYKKVTRFTRKVCSSSGSE